MSNEKKSEHVFTPIITWGHPPKTWEWCIRCGCLYLNGEIYSPGRHQNEVVQSDQELDRPVTLCVEE